MSTTMFDTEAFNEAAQALWDEARNRGYRQGKEEQIHEHAVWQARQNLDLVEKMLRSAADAESDETACLLAVYARVLLGRVIEVIEGLTVEEEAREFMRLNKQIPPTSPPPTPAS